jgi:hypothetical protein
MSSGALQFSRDLDKAFQEKVIAQCLEFHKKVALAAWRDITATARFAGGAHGSPFWSGRFRASNQISIGKPDFTTLPPMEGERWPNPVESPYKSRSVSEGAAALQGLKPFDKVFISNGLPYSRRIEYQGWSAQVPNGVYRVTAERMRQKFENVTVEALSRGIN